MCVLLTLNPQKVEEAAPKSSVLTQLIKLQTWSRFLNAATSLIKVFCDPVLVPLSEFSSTFVGRIPEQLRFVFGNVFSVQVVHGGGAGAYDGYPYCEVRKLAV